MTKTPASSEPKQTDTRFRKGQSGNPAGRPQGSRNKVLTALDEIAEGAAPKLLDTLIKAGMGGDAQSARLVLDRAWPIRKGRPVRLDLPRITDGQSLNAAMTAITSAVATGEISPEEAAAFVSVVEGHRKVLETADIEARLTALEAKLKGTEK